MNLRYLKIYNSLVGLCDASTGLLLITSPVLTLTLMGISDIPSELVYLRFVGAFVFGVGVTYWLPFVYRENTTKFVEQSKVVWMLTALIRAVVCLFVSFQILTANLSLPWISVALTDGLLALLQLILVGHLRDADV